LILDNTKSSNLVLLVVQASQGRGNGSTIYKLTVHLRFFSIIATVGVRFYKGSNRDIERREWNKRMQEMKQQSPR
jgi:hypothetical protein